MAEYPAEWLAEDEEDEYYSSLLYDEQDDIEPAVCDICGAYFAYDGGRDVCFSCRKL